MLRSPDVLYIYSTSESGYRALSCYQNTARATAEDHILYYALTGAPSFWCL